MNQSVTQLNVFNDVIKIYEYNNTEFVKYIPVYEISYFKNKIYTVTKPSDNHNITYYYKYYDNKPIVKYYKNIN